MRKRTFLIPCLFALALMTGCSKENADKYVGEQITSIKENGSEKFTELLEEGIAESNESYVLQFPEELKTPYLEFMKDSFKTIQFEVAKPSKMKNGTLSVQVTYTPINIKDTLEKANSEFMDSLESTDLTEAVSSLLEADTDALKVSPSFDAEIISTLEVSKEGESYTISEESLNTFLAQTLHGYMEPYNTVCDVLDCYDFVKAYLDASFKGDVARFALHTDRTEEEALAWYKEDVFDPPSDLTQAYIPRYQAALETMMKQCKYSVGIPKKEDGVYSYMVEIKTSPNTSFLEAYNEFEGGTYYSIEEVSAGLITAMEKYAAAPTFDEETTVTVSINASSLLDAGNENSELTALATTILMIP